MLVDRGQLDPEKPVANYWPEFAQKGKGEIQSGWSSTASPACATSTGRFRRPASPNSDLMVRLIEETTPSWEPGTQVGYHGTAMG
jgi:CubicO group peptidase (beta-lactamase class C family)